MEPGGFPRAGGLAAAQPEEALAAVKWVHFAPVGRSHSAAEADDSSRAAADYSVRGDSVAQQAAGRWMRVVRTSDCPAGNSEPVDLAEVGSVASDIPDLVDSAQADSVVG